MDKLPQRVALLLVIGTTVGIDRTYGQTASTPQAATGSPAAAAPSGDAKQGSQDSEGFALPNNKHLRVRLEFMVAFGHDDAQSELGLTNQGRIGYAKVTFAGEVTDRVSYFLTLNPVLENQPEAACGEPGYFYPNQPVATPNGPTVTCEEDGNQRVDMYKYEGLDPVVQQGPMREAYVRFKLADSVGLKFGRLIVPIGFDWQEMGSFTSKDAPRIQRIDAESDFGAVVSWTHKSGQRQILGADGGVTLGDGHRNLDYNYYYFLDPSVNSKNRLTSFGNVVYSPIEALEVRGAIKVGVTGSKIERLPDFWAAKRNDDAVVLSARYKPVRFASVFGEAAQYTWGLYPSAAGLLQMDQTPIHKNGYYIGVDAGTTVWGDKRLSTVITREEISRDDSLVKYLASQDLYGVSMGKKDRSTVVRLNFDISKQLTLGFYRNWESTPFPWISGIEPVTGAGAMTTHSTDKWGIVTRVRLP